MASNLEAMAFILRQRERERERERECVCNFWAIDHDDKALLEDPD